MQLHFVQKVSRALYYTNDEIKMVPRFPRALNDDGMKGTESTIRTMRCSGTSLGFTTNERTNTGQCSSRSSGYHPNAHLGSSDYALDINSTI